MKQYNSNHKKKNTDKDTAKIMNKLVRPLLLHGWAQGLIEI